MYNASAILCLVYFINKTPIIYNTLKIVSLLRCIIHNERKEKFMLFCVTFYALKGY